MKDYKGRGSNLQFHERKKTPHKRLVLIASILTVVAAGVYFSQGWLRSSVDSSAPKSRSDASNVGAENAIPLALPLAPPGYGSDPAGDLGKYRPHDGS